MSEKMTNRKLAALETKRKLLETAKVIIRAYNSMFIQPDPFFSAELNYYKSFRSAYDLAFETGDYSAQTAKIGGAFDVTAALKEAVKTQFENSFQDYME